MSFSQDYTITDEDGNLVAKAEPKRFTFSKKTSLLDSLGDEVLRIERELFSLKSAHYIFKNDLPVFKVTKRFGFKTNILVEDLEHDDAFTVEGDFWSKEYFFYREEEEFAFVSKKMWSFKDTYGVAVREDEDPYIIFAIVIVLNAILKRKRRSS